MKPLLEVFYRPGPMFAGLSERKHAWIIPVVCDAILLLLISMVITHFIGAENLARQQMAKLNLPPDKMEAAVAQAGSPARIYIGYAASLIFTPVILGAIAGALMVFAMMSKKPPRFGSMLAMVAVAFFPYWLASLLMTLLTLMIAPDPASMSFDNLLATNVAAFTDRNTLPKGMYSLLTSVDILSFAEIALLSYGFSKLTRVSLFAGIAAVVVLWVLYVSAKMALSLLF